MEHIGIDLGSKGSHFCRRSADGKIVEEGRVGTLELYAWLSQQAPGSRVVIETCTQAFTVSDQITDSGHEAWVIPAAIVRQLGVGYRGVKNDKRDAQVLSKASVALGTELPRVHIPCQTSRVLQRLLVQRQGLVRARTQLINAVKGQLRGELLAIRSGVSRTFAARVRDRLAGHPNLLTVLEPMLQATESLTASIKQLEEQLEQQTKDHPQVRRLMTMPGVGRLTATALVSAIDDLTRFQSAARLTSYFGLTPGENTTGDKRRLTRITKAGKVHVRALLIQAAWTFLRVAPDSALAHSFQKLSERRPKQVAIVAVARRMALILHAMMRDEKPFDPSAGKHSRTEPAALEDVSRAAALRHAVARAGEQDCIQN